MRKPGGNAFLYGRAAAMPRAGCDGSVMGTVATMRSELLSCRVRDVTARERVCDNSARFGDKKQSLGRPLADFSYKGRIWHCGIPIL